MTAGGEFSTVHSFSTAEGSAPTSVIQATDGEFYGVALGGYYLPASGTIFRTTLHDPVAAAALPTVTLTATTPLVTVGSGEAGVFTLTLSALQATDTVVHYTVKGSAANSTNYVFLKGTKKIKAGRTSKPIKIIPQGDLGGANKKVVTLVLAPGDGYTAANTDKLKVKILAAP